MQMRNGNRWLRRVFGMGRKQMTMLQGVNQFGKPRFSQGRGRNQGDKPGSGPGGDCVCPECGATTAHTTGIPCNQIECPKCGTTMTKK